LLCCCPSPPEPKVTALTPPSVEYACPEPSEEDSLSTSEIRLHIDINVVSRLNVAEKFRSLSGEELSLREFFLDQILLLEESLESCLVPRVVEELLGSKLVAPPSTKDSPSSLAMKGTVVEGFSEVACAPSPS
jgi:hypothetical protein